MRHALLAVLVAMLAVPARADRCGSEDAADAAVAAATKRNDAAYAAALAKKKLAVATLDMWQPRLPSAGGSAPVDVVVEREDRGKKFRVIAEGEREVNCDYTPPDFAEDVIAKKIYRIDRKARTTKTTHVTVCTCAAAHFSCGGANLGTTGVGFVLPDGATFAGPLTLAVDTEIVDVKYAVGRTTPCPIPAPPPSSPSSHLPDGL